MRLSASVDEHVETTPSGDSLSHQPDPIGVHCQVRLNLGGDVEFGGQPAPGLGGAAGVQDDREPIRDNLRAIAAPMPDVAPVTRATERSIA